MEYKLMGYKKVIKYGISFWKKTCNVCIAGVDKFLACDYPDLGMSHLGPQGLLAVLQILTCIRMTKNNKKGPALLQSLFYCALS